MNILASKKVQNKIVLLGGIVRTMNLFKAIGAWRLWGLLGSFIYRAFWNLIVWVIAIYLVKDAIPWIGSVFFPSATVDVPDYLSFVDKKLWVIQLISAGGAVLLLYLISGRADARARSDFLKYILDDVFGLLLTFASISILVAYFGATRMNGDWSNIALSQLAFSALNYLFAFRLWIDMEHKANNDVRSRHCDGDERNVSDHHRPPNCS